MVYRDSELARAERRVALRRALEEVELRIAPLAALTSRAESLRDELFELEEPVLPSPRLLPGALVYAALVTALTLLTLGALWLASVPVLRTCGRHHPTTRSDALEVRSAVLLYVGQEAGADCPTMNELIEAGVLDSSRRTHDAWDHPFIVECEGDDIVVRSNGPDGAPGTPDDIR